MRKLYTIESPEIIIGLGIRGPVKTPTTIAESNLVKMLNRGYIIYQHNPVELKTKTRVTIDNYKNIEFKPTENVAKMTVKKIDKQYDKRDNNKEVKEQKDDKKVKVVDKPDKFTS